MTVMLDEFSAGAADPSQRLAALETYHVLDTPPERSFDDLTELAASLCEMPVALVSLVERDRQWFKSKVGLSISETPIEQSMCAHALQSTELLEIPDTTQDPRTQANPLVTGPAAFRFYAGAVLRTPEGIDLGTLCVLDTRPRRLTDLQRTVLRTLARQVMAQLELRRLLHEQTMLLEHRLEAERRAAEASARLLDIERSARGEAERAGRLKDEFLATLSHELRTPLNAILGWSQILRDSPGNADDLSEGLATIERNARAQTQIIEDLLDMSRIISGKVRLEVQRFDVTQLMHAALATARPAADAKGLTLVTSIDADAGAISGDSSRLQQVMSNLLSNAVKFTPRGGQIELKVGRDADTLHVRVTDTGEGINPEFLPFVFDRFRQADSSATRRHGGLGLGLSIVKQLIELHGGTVAVHSDGKGAGSQFILTLPASDQATFVSAGQPLSPAASPATLVLDGLTVLVLDDEPDARALAQRVLRGQGAIVVTASSAAEAIDRIEHEPPDVLVSDIGMPNEDGLSLIRRVRALSTSRGGSIPAVALTAYARVEDRNGAVEAGFQAHLVKPLNAAELIRTIAVLAGRISKSD